MWTTEQRQAHARAGLRYPSDLTDAEWALVEPFIPPARRGGRRRTVDVREVLNGIFYVLATGCQWRALPNSPLTKSLVGQQRTTSCKARQALATICGAAPSGRAFCQRPAKDLPPRSTVHDHLTLWAWDGTLGRLHHALFVQVREQAGKEASPTAAIIDSQSVKSAEKIPCGWMAARLGRSGSPQDSMEATDADRSPRNHAAGRRPGG